jgi:hypothetical protein
MLSMDELNKSLNQVIKELTEVGLIKGDHGYLWQINFIRSPLPSFIMENGMVIDSGLSWFDEVIGYEEGEIYISKYPRLSNRVGETLSDVIRHEYAHSWAWLDRGLFRRPWFKEAFGHSYWSEKGKGSDYFSYYWEDAEPGEFEQTELYDDFVSPYALCNSSEDFAETFMYFLRYRKSLNSFKNRKGVYQKLRNIQKVISNVQDIRLIRS